MAKDLQLGEEATPATDLYALGVTLYELMEICRRRHELDSNNGFRSLSPERLDSNPEVRLQAQWGVVNKVEEVETKQRPPWNLKVGSNFSKRLFSQLNVLLGRGTHVSVRYSRANRLVRR